MPKSRRTALIAGAILLAAGAVLTPIVVSAVTGSNTGCADFSVTPGPIQARIGTTGTNNEPVVLSVTFLTGNGNSNVDHVNVTGPGITGTGSIGRSSSSAGATGSLTIPTGTSGFPCTGTASYVFTTCQNNMCT